MKRPAIAIFVYNRPEHTRRMLESLRQCDGVDELSLFVYADGAKNDDHDLKRVLSVKKIVEEITWAKDITFHLNHENLGLATSLTNGVSQTFKDFEEVIVIEDDLILSKDFLNYHRKALQTYSGDSRVFGISGYSHKVENTEGISETFFLGIISSWGWSTWRSRWKSFDLHKQGVLLEVMRSDRFARFDFQFRKFSQMLEECEKGLNDSWAIRWYAHMFLNNGLYLFPKASLVQNIGFDGSGTHAEDLVNFSPEIRNHRVALKRIEIEESKWARSEYEAFFKRQYGGKGKIHQRILTWVRKR